MASRLFPFVTAVADLITPSKREQNPSISSAINQIEENPTNPRFTRYRPNTPPTEQETRETVGWLFPKGDLVRVTYSRNFKRTFQNNNEQTSEEFIPTLPLQGVVAALKKMRSEVLSKVEFLPPALYELSSDPNTWGAMEPYIWYNILLGPYEWNVPISGKRYDTVEDQFDYYDKTLDTPAEMTVELPVEKRGDAEMLYWQNVIMCGHNVESSSAVYFIVTYQSPEEDVIVDYIRKKRKEYDISNEKFYFILFHNLLVPYVFGKAPEN